MKQAHIAEKTEIEASRQSLDEMKNGICDRVMPFWAGFLLQHDITFICMSFICVINIGFLKLFLSYL